MHIYKVPRSVIRRETLKCRLHRKKCDERKMFSKVISHFANYPYIDLTYLSLCFTEHNKLCNRNNFQVQNFYIVRVLVTLFAFEIIIVLTHSLLERRNNRTKISFVPH